jgi:hypothetical protein
VRLQVTRRQHATVSPRRTHGFVEVDTYVVDRMRLRIPTHACKKASLTSPGGRLLHGLPALVRNGPSAPVVLSPNEDAETVVLEPVDVPWDTFTQAVNDPVSANTHVPGASDASSHWMQQLAANLASPVRTKAKRSPRPPKGKGSTSPRKARRDTLQRNLVATTAALATARQEVVRQTRYAEKSVKAAKKAVEKAAQMEDRVKKDSVTNQALPTNRRVQVLPLRATTMRTVGTQTHTYGVSGPTTKRPSVTLSTQTNTPTAVPIPGGVPSRTLSNVPPDAAPDVPLCERIVLRERWTARRAVRLLVDELLTAHGRSVETPSPPPPIAPAPIAPPPIAPAPIAPAPLVFPSNRHTCYITG